uniref:Secreted protein n=1 Tax=Parascaris univalens TaxID=6257 RepID=A0A914ZIQ3_PARUN
MKAIFHGILLLFHCAGRSHRSRESFPRLRHVLTVRYNPGETWRDICGRSGDIKIAHETTTFIRKFRKSHERADT